MCAGNQGTPSRLVARQLELTSTLLMMASSALRFWCCNRMVLRTHTAHQSTAGGTESDAVHTDAERLALPHVSARDTRPGAALPPPTPPRAAAALDTEHNWGRRATQTTERRHEQGSAARRRVPAVGFRGQERRDGQTRVGFFLQEATAVGATRSTQEREKTLGRGVPEYKSKPLVAAACALFMGAGGRTRACSVLHHDRVAAPPPTSRQARGHSPDAGPSSPVSLPLTHPGARCPGCVRVCLAKAHLAKEGVGRAEVPCLFGRAGPGGRAGRRCARGTAKLPLPARGFTGGREILAKVSRRQNLRPGVAP